MSTALQCPACGSAHRLADLGDAAVFPCAQCGRSLKVPEQFRGAAREGGRADTRADKAPAAAGSVRPVGRGRARLSVRILAWIVAFILGAVVVRVLAKLTGLVGGDTLVDLLLENSLSNYLRLAILVPVWGLFTALFATAFLEGPQWFAERRARSGASPPDKVVPKEPAASDRSGKARIPKASKASKAAKATAVGAAVAAEGGKAVSEPDVTRHIPVGAGATSESRPSDDAAERAASGQRPRRIPRRGAAS